MGRLHRTVGAEVDMAQPDSGHAKAASQVLWQAVMVALCLIRTIAFAQVVVPRRHIGCKQVDHGAPPQGHRHAGFKGNVVVDQASIRHKMSPASGHSEESRHMLGRDGGGR